MSGACSVPAAKTHESSERTSERVYTTTLILPCYTQRTPPKAHPTRPPLLPSLCCCRRHPAPPWPCLAVLLRLLASPLPPPPPPPSAQYHHHPPAVATIYPPAETSTKAQPSYLTSSNSPPSYTAPARLWQPAYFASGLLHPTPHRRTPRLCPPASTQQPDILVRPRPSAAFVLPTPSPPFPCSVAHGHAALTSASRLLAYHPAHPTQLGRRSRV